MKRVLAVLLIASAIASTVTGCGYMQPANTDNTTNASSTWVCNECGAAGNTGKFCGDCGAERKTKTDGSWTCSSCGASGNTGKFCADCGKPKDGDTGAEQKPTETSSVQEQRPAETSTVNEQRPAETSTTQEQRPAETTPTYTESNTSPSGDRDGSLNNPYKIGEMFYVKKYNATANDYQDVGVKITGILKGAEANRCIDEYNAHSSYGIEVEADDSVELCVFTYEVYFPSSYTMPEWGVSGNVNIPLGLTGLDGGSVKNDSKWLSQITANVSVTDYSDTYFSGDTFTKGREAYQMFPNFDSYLIKVGDTEPKYVKVN